MFPGHHLLSHRLWTKPRNELRKHMHLASEYFVGKVCACMCEQGLIGILLALHNVISTSEFCPIASFVINREKRREEGCKEFTTALQRITVVPI